MHTKSVVAGELPQSLGSFKGYNTLQMTNFVQNRVFHITGLIN